MSEERALKEPDQTVPETEGLIEITTYIREDQQFALELIENTELAASGKFNRDEVIREALDMLINTRIKAVDLRRLQQQQFLKTGGE